jgi:hypothetical protein
MSSKSGSNPQTVWEETSRKGTKHHVNDDWVEEQKYRTECGQPLIVGYRITTGKNCPQAKPFDGSTFLIEDAYDAPDLLPPYGGCNYDTCKCEYTRVMADDGGRARIVLEFNNPELNAKLVTRRSSPVGWERSSRGRTARGTREVKWSKSAGCSSVLLAGFVLFLFAGIVMKLI